MHARPYASASAHARKVLTHERFQRAPVEQAPLLTKQQVAARLGVSTRTIDRWVRAGLPYQQVASRRRFNYASVLKWAEVAGRDHL